MRQLSLLISVEMKEYLREPGIIFWAILFPILLALGLGLAFSGGGVQERTVAVVCKSGPCNVDMLKGEAKSGAAWSHKVGNEKLGFTRYEFKMAKDWDEAVLLLKQGKTGLIIELLDDKLQYHFDPANSDAMASYIQLTDYFKGREVSAEEVSVLRQKGTRYIDFLVPGLFAMGIMMSCMWGISYTNVDRRNKKLLRRMVATPMKKYHYVAAQLIARIILSAVEAFLLVLVTYLIFDISITGSFAALVMLFLAGNMAFTGLAILLASRTANTQIANALINLMIMPMMILSGVYFSYHNFPDFMIALIRYLPLTLLADSVRSVFIEGAGLVESLPYIAVLAVFGLVLFVIGIRVYKWY